MLPKDFDYVVVGAGAAGCIVASRLSENPGVRVALVEAGGPDRHPLLKVPLLGVFVTNLGAYNWDFAIEPDPNLDGRVLRWAAGRGIGGSSSINGMIYSRGHSQEYRRWRDAGCEGWAFEDVLPFFKKAETHARGEGRYHGGSGPMRVRPSKPALPVCSAFLAAAAEAGFPLVDDLNADVAEGFGHWDVNIHGGRRISTATAYLRPARKRTNLTIFTEATALRIAIERGRANGVEIDRAGERSVLRAEREVVVCAGGIGSPKLLMLSGIGPPDHLRELGIGVTVEAPEVGANLQNHPSYRLQYTCTKPITAYGYLRPLPAAGAALRYALARGGPLAESYVSTGGFSRVDPSHDAPDIMTVMGPALIGRGSVGGKMRDLLPTQHGFTFGATLGRPNSRGRLRLRSADPSARPAIFANYFDDPADMRTLVAGVSRLREIAHAKSLRDVIGTELQPGAGCTDDRGLEASIRAKCTSAHHPMSTCRMGGDPQSVVDTALRVRGVAGLRVADASIMPSALCAGPHGPTIMIGERAADLIARDAAFR